MKRIISILIIVLAYAATSFAQMGTPLTQHSGNRVAFNPGYAGMDGDLLATLSVRRQWIHLPGAPRIVNFSAHMPTTSNDHALGLVFQQEEMGATQATFGYANYAYMLHFGESVLSLGVQAGFYNSMLDWDKIRHIVDPEDPLVKQTGRDSRIRLDVNVGAYFLTHEYYLGISVKHLAPPRLNFDRNIPKDAKWYPRLGTQFFLMGGMIIPLEDDWSLRPEAFVRLASGAIPSVSVGALGGYQGRYFFGMAYKTGQHTASVSVRGVLTPKFRLGYSYDVPLGRIRTAQAGSHEVTMGYLFNNLRRRIDRVVWI